MFSYALTARMTFCVYNSYKIMIIFMIILFQMLRYLKIKVGNELYVN